METETSTQAGTPPPPAGIHLRQLDPDKDLRAAHRILEEAFQEDWDYSPTSFEEFIDLNVTQDDFDPALWIIAVEAGEPVGLLHGSAHTDRGWIDELGVLRSHRGRGIATALLRRSIAQFGRRGLARVRLNVDSDNVTGAVALYTRAGMHVVSSYDLWARAVEGRRR